MSGGRPSGPPTPGVPPTEGEKRPRLMKDLTPTQWHAIGMVVAVIEAVVVVIGAWYFLGGHTPPVGVSLAFLAIAFGSFIALVFTKWDAAPLKAFKVQLAALFGYLLIAVAIGGAFYALAVLQPTATTGMTTSEVNDGALTFRTQTQSRIDVSPIQFGNISVPVVVSLGFGGTNVTAFNGTATFTVKSLDPPLRLAAGEDGKAVLDAGRRADGIALEFDPRVGLRGDSFAITYVLEYNLTVPSFASFGGAREGSLSIGIRSSGFTTSWYLMFIFLGILTSFGWRLMNTLLDRGHALPQAWDANRQIAYLVFLPLASLIIALVVFRQFQESLTASTDPLVNAVAGFSYGFFWENAAKKFGSTLSIAGSQMQKEEKAKAEDGGQ